jgi:hypothetical protein
MASAIPGNSQLRPAVVGAARSIFSWRIFSEASDIAERNYDTTRISAHDLSLTDGLLYV